MLANCNAKYIDKMFNGDIPIVTTRAEDFAKKQRGKSVKLANHCYAKTSFVYFKNTQTMQILNNSSIRSVDFIYFLAFLSVDLT